MKWRTRLSWWDRWFSNQPPEPPPGWPGSQKDSYGNPTPGPSNRQQRDPDRTGRTGDEDPGKAPEGDGASDGPTLPRWQQRQLIGGPDDDVDSMLADPEKFERWELSRDLRQVQWEGYDPDDALWESWLDDPDDYDYKSGGWYDSQPDWDKGGVPREAPSVPERGMSRSFKELLLRIFQPQDEVEEQLTFEEKVFRYTSQTSVREEGRKGVGREGMREVGVYYWRARKGGMGPRCTRSSDAGGRWYLSRIELWREILQHAVDIWRGVDAGERGSGGWEMLIESGMGRCKVHVNR